MKNKLEGTDMYFSQRILRNQFFFKEKNVNSCHQKKKTFYEINNEEMMFEYL